MAMKVRELMNELENLEPYAEVFIVLGHIFPYKYKLQAVASYWPIPSEAPTFYLMSHSKAEFMPDDERMAVLKEM
ncbi:MAG: hypothetical protein WC822_06520 [Candidatus Paceibacterota bacterium]|jgi:hypothetical protein